jgi:cysteinyl-tRNA synthetase
MHNAKLTLEHLTEKGADEMTDGERESLAGLGKYRDKFIASMDDDLNTADAIAAIFELISEVNGVVSGGASKDYAKAALAELLELANVLGLLACQSEAEGAGADASPGGRTAGQDAGVTGTSSLREPNGGYQAAGTDDSAASGIDDHIRRLIDERAAAREAKDWVRADEIRDELAALGVTLKDTPQGVQVVRA